MRMDLTLVGNFGDTVPLKINLRDDPSAYIAADIIIITRVLTRGAINYSSRLGGDLN